VWFLGGEKQTHVGAPMAVRRVVNVVLSPTGVVMGQTGAYAVVLQPVSGWAPPIYIKVK